MDVSLPSRPTDPQGIYFRGNEMRVTPRGIVRFGELYRNGGRHAGPQLVPEYVANGRPCYPAREDCLGNATVAIAYPR